MTDEKLEIYEGTGNVFRDTNVPDADVKMLKVRVAAAIITILDETKMTVRQAGKVAGVHYGDFSSMRNADLSRFTLDKLLTILKRLEPGTELDLRLTRHSAEAAAHPAM